MLAAPGLDAAAVKFGGGGQKLRIAQLLALRPLGSECILGTLGGQPTLLLGQRGVEVQQERIDVGTQLGDGEPAQPSQQAELVGASKR